MQSEGAWTETPSVKRAGGTDRFTYGDESRAGDGRNSAGKAILYVGDGKFFLGEAVYVVGDGKFSLGKGKFFVGAGKFYGVETVRILADGVCVAADGIIS
ncbi:MAG: hypothetical protein ACJ754_02765, partial [Pyrinomonadaceae bacterium]